MKDVVEAFRQAFPELRIKINEPLARYSTIRIGGPAEIFLHVQSRSELEKVLTFVSKNFPKLPLTIIGNASNVLTADEGLKGIVIKNSATGIKILKKLKKEKKSSLKQISTQRDEKNPRQYLDFSKLDYDESNQPQIMIEIDSGTPLPYAINSLIKKGVTGLQWFAGIPGTMGGATWYNIHGGSYHLSDYIEAVKVFDLKTGKVKTLRKKDLDFAYEQSSLQKHRNLIILSTVLKLYLGDAKKAASTAKEWIAQKMKCQPQNSLGSAFQNLDQKTAQKHHFESRSVGWVIDQKLNWKGKKIGGAQISPLHANFIVNAGKATAKDYLALIELIKNEFKKRWKINLKPEITRLTSP